MKLIIFEDHLTKNLEPFSLNHAVFEIKTGLFSNIDRFIDSFPKHEVYLIVRDEIKDIIKFRFPKYDVNPSVIPCGECINAKVVWDKDYIKLFYEVGVGCGMYSLKTLQNINDVVGIGYDISDYSLNFTKNIIDENKFQSRYSVENYDLTKRPVEKEADLIISQEVLEHLENPQEFIISLYKSVRNNGWGYITAAINAGHTDHIYLYKSPEEVEKQLLSAGWKILKRNIEYANDYTPLHIRPTIAAYLLQK